MEKRKGEELSVDQVAEVLGVHSETVRDLIRTGRIPATMTSRRAGYRIANRDLTQYLSAQLAQDFHTTIDRINRLGSSKEASEVRHALLRAALRPAEPSDIVETTWVWENNLEFAPNAVRTLPSDAIYMTVVVTVPANTDHEHQFGVGLLGVGEQWSWFVAPLDVRDEPIMSQGITVPIVSTLDLALRQFVAMRWNRRELHDWLRSQPAIVEFIDQSGMTRALIDVL